MLSDTDVAVEPLILSCIFEINRKFAARPKNSTNGDHTIHT